MANRLTQIAAETLAATGNPKARLTQAAVESLSGPGNPKVRLTQIAVEYLVLGVSAGVLAGITPSTGAQGQTLTVTITGTATHFAAGATTVGISGSGVSASSVTVTSPLSLTATFTITSGATVGARTVTVTTGTEVPTTTFTVTAVSQRGVVDYDQIRMAARQGYGSKIQMFGGGATVAGHVAVYDANGNVVDGGTGSAISSVLPIRLVSSDYTMTSADYTVVAVSLLLTITLPASPATGQLANVKNGNATAGQTITVSAGGIAIDGAASVVLDAMASVQVQWDGSQWRILLGLGVFY